MCKFGLAELLDQLDDLIISGELDFPLDSYLYKAISEKKISAIKKLIQAGANPDGPEPLKNYLLLLMHEYQVERTLHGEDIIKVMEVLLENGANPNLVAMNNLRAYDYCVSYGLSELSEVLLKHGASPELREAI